MWKWKKGYWCISFAVKHKFGIRQLAAGNCGSRLPYSKVNEKASSIREGLFEGNPSDASELVIIFVPQFVIVIRFFLLPFFCFLLLPFFICRSFLGGRISVAASVGIDFHCGGTAITFVKKYTSQVMTLDTGHSILLKLRLSDDANDRKNKNESHRGLGCDTERTICFNEGDFYKDQIQGEKETRERRSEKEHGPVLVEEARISFEQEDGQDGGIPNDPEHCHRDAVDFRIAAGIHHRTIFGADAHAVVGCNFVNGHINRNEQTNDCERNECNCDF